MPNYKKIEGQCGTCGSAIEFGYPPSPGEATEGVHCSSENLARRLDAMDDFQAYGFSDLYRLEVLAEESYRCPNWTSSEAWRAEKEGR